MSSSTALITVERALIPFPPALNFEHALKTTAPDSEKPVKKEKSDKVLACADAWRSIILPFLPFEDVRDCLVVNKQLSSYAAKAYVTHPDFFSRTQKAFDKIKLAEPKDQMDDWRLKSLSKFAVSPRYWELQTNKQWLKTDIDNIIRSSTYARQFKVKPKKKDPILDLLETSDFDDIKKTTTKLFERENKKLHDKLFNPKVLQELIQEHNKATFIRIKPLESVFSESAFSKVMEIGPKVLFKDMSGLIKLKDKE